MIDDHSISSRSLANSPGVFLRESRVGVRDEQDIVALDTASLTPGRHDEGVVVGHKSDSVDALGLQLLNVLDEAGKV